MNSRLPPAWSKHLKVASQPAAKPAVRIQNHDETLKRAREHREKGQLREADQLCARVLKLSPDNPQALFLAGNLALDVEDDDLAIQYFERAVKEKPKDPYFHLILAETQAGASEFELAIRHFRRALTLKPNLVEALCGLGRTYVAFGKAELALPFYEKALRIDRDHKAVRIGYADALTSLGRMDEAVAYLRESISRRRDMPRAYNAFAATRKFSSEPAELKSIIAELADPALSQAAANQLHYAAGKILNDLGRYEDAIDHFQKAKAATRNNFDVQAYRTWVDQMIDVFNPAMLEALPALGDPSELPVFVVGMPRSGTTLVEQICASHPDVHGAGELYKFARVANSFGLNRTSLEPFRKALADLNEEKSRSLAADYLSYVRRLSPDALRIVDKMPHNFETIGFIALLFPNARIIHCRRDAIDNCVSCFTTGFNKHHGYNADMQKLGLYYREYDRLMRHWNAILPGRIYECRYETLIEDQEAESRRLIDHLGLPWDEACLRFYDQNRSVNTPSRWQVRQPVYRTSVKRWKNYEGKIQPLIDALGDLAEV
jgi:tetratricopeptide (TPR) repeat protein